MARKEVILCDCCFKEPLGADAAVEVGLQFPKLSFDLCSACRASLFSDMALTLDAEAVVWFREALNNRARDFETGKLRREWNPT